MKDNISPEERLLKLIKGQKKGPQTASGVTGIKPIHPGGSSTQDTSGPAAGGNFSGIKRPFFSGENILKAVLLAGCLYLVFTLVYPLFGFGKIAASRTDPVDLSELEKKAQSGFRPFDFYLDGIKGRQIFSERSGQSASGAAAGGMESELIKDINLLGIISGDNPQAIIEDKKSQKTFYVSRGEFVGQFQVEEIQDGKVTLTYQGQRFDLYL